VDESRRSIGRVGWLEQCQVGRVGWGAAAYLSARPTDAIDQPARPVRPVSAADPL